MKEHGLVFTWLGSLILVIVSLATANGVAAVIAGAAFILFCYVIFRDTLNLVQYVGRVYWIVRDSVPEGTPRISRGFMRMVAPPWLVGSGVQVRVMQRTIQVGICYRQDAADETEGVLAALDGRLMDDDPKKIGNWQ